MLLTFTANPVVFKLIRIGKCHVRIKITDDTTSIDYNCLEGTIGKGRICCDTTGHVTKTCTGFGKGKTVRRGEFLRKRTALTHAGTLWIHKHARMFRVGRPQLVFIVTCITTARSALLFHFMTISLVVNGLFLVILSLFNLFSSFRSFFHCCRWLLLWL